MSSKKLNSFILEELLDAATDRKLSILPQSAKCTYNAFMFGRNYFAGINCSCYSSNKELICAFCSHLKEHLNYHVKKVCIEVSDKKDLPFQVMPSKNTCTIKRLILFLFLMSNMNILKL